MQCLSHPLYSPTYTPNNPHQNCCRNHREGSGIVYCLSRDDTEQVAQAIRTHTDIAAAHYHAGMTPKQRTAVQNDWRTGAVRVVVATIAFGMGVDKVR